MRTGREGGEARDAHRSRLAVALDTADWSTFESWCETLGAHVGCLKVGLEAYVRWGPKAVECARRSSPRVFLDLKLHDIPNTVAGAVRAACRLDVALITVHAGGGHEMLAAAVESAGDRLRPIAVTVLTHLDEPALQRLGLPGSSASRARDWARLAAEAGCGGVVCSPLEVASLRRESPADFLLVTPGIRPGTSDVFDQRRVATPREALRDGSDLLVIGRPITGAPDPRRAVELILDELAEPR